MTGIYMFDVEVELARAPENTAAFSAALKNRGLLDVAVDGNVVRAVVPLGSGPAANVHNAPSSASMRVEEAAIMAGVDRPTTIRLAAAVRAQDR